MDGWMDSWMDDWVGGWVGEWVNGRMDGGSAPRWAPGTTLPRCSHAQLLPVLTPSDLPITNIGFLVCPPSLSVSRQSPTNVTSECDICETSIEPPNPTPPPPTTTTHPPTHHHTPCALALAGLSSILFWVCAQTPQLVMNCRMKDGLYGLIRSICRALSLHHLGLCPPMHLPMPRPWSPHSTGAISHCPHANATTLSLTHSLTHTHTTRARTQVEAGALTLVRGCVARR